MLRAGGRVRVPVRARCPGASGGIGLASSGPVTRSWPGSAAGQDWNRAAAAADPSRRSLSRARRVVPHPAGAESRSARRQASQSPPGTTIPGPHRAGRPVRRAGRPSSARQQQSPLPPGQPSARAVPAAHTSTHCHARPAPAVRRPSRSRCPGPHRPGAPLSRAHRPRSLFRPAPSRLPLSQPAPVPASLSPGAPPRPARRAAAHSGHPRPGHAGIRCRAALVALVAATRVASVRAQPARHRAHAGRLAGG